MSVLVALRSDVESRDDHRGALGLLMGVIVIEDSRRRASVNGSGVLVIQKPSGHSLYPGLGTRLFSTSFHTPFQEVLSEYHVVQIWAKRHSHLPSVRGASIYASSNRPTCGQCKRRAVERQKCSIFANRARCRYLRICSTCVCVLKSY
jgi:hypothetical protein